MKISIQRLFLVVVVLFSMLVTGCGNQDAKTTAETKKPQEQQKQEVKTPPTFKVGNETIELVEKTVLDGKITLYAPKGFEKMSEDMKEVKYPSTNRPTEILTNKEGTINIALNHTKNKLSNEQMQEFKDAMVKMLKNAQPAAQWLAEEVKPVNNKNVAVLEFISPAIDAKIYNKMLIMSLDERALIISFNCTEKEMKDWKPIGTEMLNSLKIK